MYRESLLDELAGYRKEGVNSVVLSSVNDGHDNYRGEVFPIRDGDNVVADQDTLSKAVEFIMSLHDKMIRVPVCEKGKEFVKKPVGGVTGD